jgi:hypothetical protein
MFAEIAANATNNALADLAGKPSALTLLKVSLAPIKCDPDVVGGELGGSSSGRTADSDSANQGSNPCPPAK